MANTKGFSLTECLIYSFIVIFLSLLVFKFFVTSSASIAKMSKKNSSLMAVYATHDLLVRDVYCASCEPEFWVNTSPNSFVCRSNTASIGWELKKDKLYRISGSYNYQSKDWADKSWALVAQGVEQLSVTLTKTDNEVDHAQIILCINGHIIDRIIYLNNRVVS